MTTALNVIEQKKIVGNSDFPTRDNAEIDINQVSASKPPVPFGYNPSTTTALTFGYYGGEMLVDGVLTNIANSTLLLTASVTNYVEATRAGVVSENSTAFTAGLTPLFEITTDTVSITNINDRRIGIPPVGLLSLSVAGGVGDTTLTAAQTRNNILQFTGALTGNRNIIVPVSPQSWGVFNDTTGAFTLTVKTAAGTGVLVTQGASASVYCVGVNVVSDNVAGSATQEFSASTFTGAGTGLTGTAAGLTAGNVTTNANLTGVITSSGNATSIASQTGTGSTFVVDTSPVLVTPNLGTPSAGTLTNCTFPTFDQDTTGTASKTNALNSATTVVNVSSATAPTVGQILMATSGTAATWQTPSGPSLTGGVTSIGNAATVVTNANLTGGVTSVGNAATVVTNANLTGVITSVGNATSVADSALSIAKTSGLQTALDLKAPLASPTFTGTVTVPTPSNAMDASTKGYVDALKQALDIKDSVRVASTANIAVASALVDLSVIDGVTVATGNRVLLKNQTATAENGIWVVVASGAASRSTDADISTEVTTGLYTFVSEGTASAGTGFVLTTADPITLGATGLTFTVFSGAGQVIAGNGLSESGNTLSINTAITADLSTAQTFTNKSISGGQITSAVANATLADKVNALNSATTVVNVSSAAAPTVGQLLTATGASAATWQTPAPGTTIGFGTTGLTPSAASSGAVTVAGILGIANGGTGNTSGNAATATTATTAASCTGNAATATTATTSANLSGSGGSYISSSQAGTSYGAGVQVRERGLAGAQGNAMTAAPMLAWHWSGVVASSMMLEASGRIGIYNNPGTAYEAFACGTLTATGEIRATDNVTAYYASDKKFKENINPIVNALYIVEQIGGKTFDWTDDYVERHGGEDGYFVSKSDFGVVAQDVQAVFPKAVKVKPDGSLAVDYIKLSSLAFQAIIELSERVKQLESK